MPYKMLFLSLLFFISCSVEQLNPESITSKTSKSEDDGLLTKLYTEIESLASSKSCQNANNWLISPFGSKACGGPAGYIAYSTEIDVKAFLAKVENYTNMSMEYNKKHKIVSDCSLALPPNSIVCENGKPIFKY